MKVEINYLRASKSMKARWTTPWTSRSLRLGPFSQSATKSSTMNTKKGMEQCASN